MCKCKNIAEKIQCHCNVGLIFSATLGIKKEEGVDEMISLIGVLIVVLGLAFGFNPVATVFVAGLTTGLVVGIPVVEIIETIGQTFVNNRTMLIFVLTLPAIGLLEKHGLKEYAAALILRFKGATAGRVSFLYLFLRWLSSVLGLRLGGHPVFVRPLVSPMAEGTVKEREALEKQDPVIMDRVKAMTAASENYGNFFGQNIFVAAAGLILIQGVMAEAGYEVSLATMALYSLPAGIAALVLAFVQFTFFDRWLKQKISAGESGDDA